MIASLIFLVDSYISNWFDLLGLVQVTLTDNGDGITKVKFVGNDAQKVDLEGMNFDTFADQLCSDHLE